MSILQGDHSTKSREGSNSRKGQSIVEFVLTLPVLLLILAGVLDVGRLYFAYVAVTDVAGEGVGYAAAFLPPDGGQCPDIDDLECDYDPHDEEYKKDKYRRDLDCTCERAYAATSGIVRGEDLDVVVTVPGGTAFGDAITVTVRYTHPLVTPLINAMVPGGGLPLTAYATERVVDPNTE